ncbi:MAG: hypothetical protein VKK04_23300 [Synechococcales bacterium]|nr:hypothetical protein [Synechococcales bacterium]
MLRLIYTETGLDLKVIDQPMKDWIALRRTLAHRTGHVFRDETCTASFLLPRDLRQMGLLKRLVTDGNATGVDLTLADAEFMEVSLRGHWVSSCPADAEGVFIAAFPVCLEKMIAEMWAEACDRVTMPQR